MISLQLKNNSILKNKKTLEKELVVLLNINDSEVLIDGESENEFIAQQVLNAINFGFPIKIALLIKQEDLLFEIIRIKDYTSKKNLGRIRSRIIGIKGKTLRTLTELSDCFFELNTNEIGIIGVSENIKNVNNAIISLIKGSKQANVYNYLEKHPHEEIMDLGLKEYKKPNVESEEKLDWENNLSKLGTKKKRISKEKKVISSTKEIKKSRAAPKKTVKKVKKSSKS